MDFYYFKLNQTVRIHGAASRFIALMAREQCQPGDHFPFSAPDRACTIKKNTLPGNDNSNWQQYFLR